VDAVSVRGGPLSVFDCWTTMVSLPGIFGTVVETIPARVPYLEPDSGLVARWRDELPLGRVLRIGIAWQGSPSHTRDRYRSLPLAEFAGIAALPGVRLYSLQLGPGREQLAEVAGDWPITDLGDRLGDFYNTAAIMRNLDLVITCDSSPAHLAGALGVPVWVALAFLPDWRWMLDREDSPWYPTMRLFRQKSFADWSDPFARMRDELTRMSA
jgi:hypothetical protein